MRLRHYREAAGLTQVQLATLTGVDQGKISRIERGLATRTRLDTIRRLANAVGVSIDDIAVPADVDDTDLPAVAS